MIYKEEYRFWTFDPSLQAQPGMQALFYSMDFYHKGFETNTYGLEEEPLVQPDEYQQNVAAWKAYCNSISPDNLVTSEDIYEVLYRLEPTDYFTLYPSLKDSNSFVAFYANKPFIKKYIEIAKRVEFQCHVSDAWDCADCPKIMGEGKIVPADTRYYFEEDLRIKPNAILAKQIIKETQVFLQETHSDFLRTRFAFQFVRLGFYLQDSALMAYHYQRYLDKLPNTNWLKNAASLYEIDNYTGATKNYKLSQIFEAVPNLRFTCENAFDNTLLQETLLLAKTPHERAMILVIHASRRHQEMLPILAEIRKLDPNNKFLPGLWIREINKLEDWILGPKYTEFGSTKKEQLYYDFGWDETEKVNAAVASQVKHDKQYAQKVYAALSQTLPTLGNNNNDFYKLCAAYVAFILQDLQGAQEHLQAIQVNQLDERGKTQFLITQLMVSLSAEPQTTESLLANFMAVYKHLLLTENKYPQRKYMRNYLTNFMASECIQRGAQAEGFLLYGQSNKPYASHNLMGISNMYTHVYKYAEPNDIIQMLQLLQKPNKSEFEQLVSGNVYEYANDYNEQKLPVSKDKLRDILSMKWVQQDKLKEALLVLKQIDTNYWNNEVYSDFKQDDPFWVSPNDGQDPLNLRGVQYNKVTFLKELIALKTRAQKLSGEAKALTLYKIANAYYSMGYAGKYWIMQKNYQLQDREYDNDKDVNPEYYQAQRARYYYKEALKNSSDPKLLALILFALDHAFYQLPGTRERIVAKEVFKKKNISPDFYEQLSGNCNLFYELIETYN